jgi:hypothetical protein
MITRLNRAPDGDIQLLHIAQLISTFHSAWNLIEVIASFPKADIVSRLALDRIPMACIDFKAYQCLLDPAEIQEGPDPSSEIEEQGTEAPIPIWLRLLDIEVVALLKDY